MGNVRVLPLLVFAGLCLFALKALGLLLSGSYVLSGSAPASAQNTPAVPPTPAVSQAEPASPADGDAKSPDDGSAQDEAVQAAGKNPASEEPEMKMAAQDEAEQEDGNKRKPLTEKQKLERTDLRTGGHSSGKTKSELAVLEGLANRRKALDKRSREIDLRENLLKAAEKRVEARIAELKTIEARIEGELKKRDDHRKEQYQSLVKMYSGMKPKDAARIFDRLELKVLTGLVSQMKPRVMSAILASMNPAAAERLTLEIANRGKPQPSQAASLPKIESQ